MSSINSPLNMKTTPLKMGTISKKLLTPCRRVGLGRKVVRTPGSTPVIQKTNNITYSSTVAETTPLATESKPHIAKDTKEVKSTKHQKAKKTLKLEKELCPSKIDNTSFAPHTETAYCSSDNASISISTNSSIQLVLQDKDLNIDNSKCQDSRPASKQMLNKKATKKRFAKCLSMNKTSSSDEASDLEEPLFTNIPTLVATQVSQLSSPHNSGSDYEKFEVKAVASKRTKRQIIDTSSDEEVFVTSQNSLNNKGSIKESDEQVANIKPNMENDCDDNLANKSTVNRPNKRQTIGSSSDEDDFIPSQNSLKNNESIENLHKKIENIKQSIKIKKVQLENLKQAAIYRKLHDVDKLNELTEVWKKGCHDALRYLLDKLQSHGPMNMSVLLQNLGIPKELIDYNISNDSFI